MTSQVLNYNKDLEIALLGAILLNPGVLDRIPTEPDHFFNESLREIFIAMRELRDQRTAIDIITLGDKLTERGKMNKAGGPAGIAKLIEYSGPSYHAEDYAERLAELYDNRELMRLAQDTAQKAAEGGDPTAVVSYIMQALPRIGKRGGGAVHISVSHQRSKEMVRQRKEKAQAEFSLKTLFPDLDRVIGPTYPDEGTLMVLIGEAGLGKSILMRDIAGNWATQAPGVIFSQEMTEFRLMVRDYATKTDLDAYDIKSGRIDLAELDKLDPFYERLPIYLDTRRHTVGSLRAEATRLKEEAGIRWVWIDYLSLMEDRYAGEEHQRQEVVLKGIHSTCRDLHVVGGVIHTPNKSGDIAGVQLLKHHPDITMKLEDNSLPGIKNSIYRTIELKVMKNRDGKGGKQKIELGLLHDKPHFVTPY